MSVLHRHTIWKLMRKYTSRQIESDSVDDVVRFLEVIVWYIVQRCETLLKCNATEKTRISRDCVRAILNSKREISFSSINRECEFKKK